MEPLLNEIEVRILGSLIEKEFSTPEYYPLTLNALVNACNQKSSRDPVVDYNENTVEQALQELRKKGMVLIVRGAGIRVPKYRQVLKGKLNLNLPGLAILAVLMLRGPQTIGEIRSRADRIYTFEDLNQVEEQIQQLIDAEPGLVRQLSRQPGQKESRYMHLLAGEPDIAGTMTLSPVEIENSEANELVLRIEKLEAEIADLHTEISALKAEFKQFKSQFE